MDRDIAGGASIIPMRDERHEIAATGDATHAALSGDAGDAAGRNAIFSHLVKSDTDINGLVAYSIYKQNKLDWLAAFEAAKQRLPDEAELSSYIIGEGTPRRLATYRQLAVSTLARQAPAGGETANRRDGGKLTLASRATMTYAALAVLFVVGFWLAAHFTLAGR